MPQQIDRLVTGEASALTLAYLGDVIYEFYVRSTMVKTHPRETAHQLHVRTVSLVRNEAQAYAMIAIYDALTEEERAVFRRGRNAKGNAVPRNAHVANYRVATGFEALLGQLYLQKRHKRLAEILELCREKGWRKGEPWDR